MKPLNAKQLKELRETLEERYGYSGGFDYIVFETEEHKYYIASREVEEFLDHKLRIERIGVYFGQLRYGELRLSIEGSQLIGPRATKRVVELTIEQRDSWMLGRDVVIEGNYEQAFYIVKHNDDFMGCGKIKNNVLLNYVPKERYIGAVFTVEGEF